MILDLKIVDTTLRDGEQAPGFAMEIEQKVTLAKQIEKLGVDIIDAGFPATSKDDIDSIKLISQECQKAEISCLVRCLENDIEKGLQALEKAKKGRIVLFIATSDIHMIHKLKMSKKEVMDRAFNAIALATKSRIKISFCLEDATRTNQSFLKEMIEMLLQTSVDTIIIADTVGYCLPKEYGEIIKFIKTIKGIEKVRLSAHCHNDLGLAVANTLQGVIDGATQIEGTLLGIGERAGNASLEELIMAIQTKKSVFPPLLNINTKELYKSCRMLADIVEIEIPPNKAIVGSNAFAHGSGIHQHGIIERRETYEILKPEDIGIEISPIVLTRHSGRKGLAAYLKDKNIELSNEDLDRVFQEFKKIAATKKQVSDEDLRGLMNEMGQRHET